MNARKKLAFSATDRISLQAWRKKTERMLRRLSGYDTMIKTPLKPGISEEKSFPCYLRQRVEIETEPGVRMPLYVLIPRKGKRSYPAIIACHGHLMAGKLGVAGCRKIPAVASAIKRFNCNYGLDFVRAGFIVFCPDARGFGERQDEAVRGDILASSCELINRRAHSLGQTIVGMWTWDLHRLIDYIETRPDCRKGKVGCAGLSGGGLQTLWAAGLDTRIRCAIISGYFYGVKESLSDMPENCSCNYIPHLFEYVDMGDIAALIAPRPLLVETGDEDPLNGKSGLANVLPQVRITRRAYRLLGAEDKFRHYVFRGGHCWQGKEAISWMRQYLL